MLFSGLLTAGCTPAANGGFAIYLLKDAVPPTKLAALSYVEIADNPIISEGDIVSYEEASHLIVLTAGAFQRLAKLHVPTSGLSFAVCLNGSPVYTGAFWTPISSQSFDGVTIMQTLPGSDENAIQISLGYPGPGFFASGQPDPRGDTGLMGALRAAGKLR